MQLTTGPMPEASRLEKVVLTHTHFYILFALIMASVINKYGLRVSTAL